MGPAMPPNEESIGSGDMQAALASLQLLLDSFVAVASERDIETILERAVDLARLSTRARYGAAAAISGGLISAFVHAGLTQAQVEAMPHLPRGLGMLGAVLDGKAPIRLDVLQEDPRSVGFPLGHVPMTAFLGVPILLAGNVTGAIYLTKSPGQGMFSEQDELFVVSLANQTAVAMETAMLLRELGEKTATMTLLQDVAAAANEASTVDEAFATALDRVCSYTGWPVGHVYMTDESGEVMLPTSIWHLDDPARFSNFRTVTESTPLPSGIGLPGRVHASAKPAWINDVREDPNFPRAGAALSSGVGAGFGFPVLVGTEVAAILEFFTAEAAEPNEPLLDIMGHIGTQLGRVIERKRVEDELRRLDAVKTEFIANAAHELRTPLTTIAGFSDLLRRGRHDIDDATLDRTVEALGRQTSRIRSLIENLLDLSQMDLGRLTVSLQPVSVEGTVKRVLEMTPPPDGASVKFSAEEDDISVLADLPRLDQIMSNLLGNAYRYGGSTITVTARRRDGIVEVSVADDGPGVPVDLLDHLFEPFTRGSNAPKVQGSGLGLAICRRLVQAFGGSITHEPSDPHGAQFVLRLKGPE